MKKVIFSAVCLSVLLLTRVHAEPDVQINLENGKSIKLDFKKEIKLYEPKEEIRFILSADPEVAGKLRIEVSNPFLKIKNLKEYDIKSSVPGYTAEDSFVFEKNGCYTFTCTLTTDGKQGTPQSVSVGVMPRAKKPAGNQFYFATQPFLFRHFEWDGLTFDGKDREEGYQLGWEYLTYLGVNVVREGNTWVWMQPNKESPINFSIMDKVVADAKAKGITVDWHIGSTPRWALMDKYRHEKDSWTLTHATPEMPYWINYVRAVAERYKSYDNVIYEVVNEPNWEFWKGTEMEYIELLEETAKTIKQINPKAIVMPGGLVIPGDKDDRIYYSKLKLLKDKKLIDYVGYHSHGRFSAVPYKHYPVMQELSQRYGLSLKDVFLNESGIQHSDGRKQAEEVMRKALWSLAHDHKMFVLFMFRGFGGAGDKRVNNNWAIVTGKAEPRESYIAYGALIRMLDGAKLQERVSDHDHYAYIFDSKRGSLVTVFKEDYAVKAELKVKEGLKFKVLDIYGNEVQNSKLLVENLPYYLEFESKITKNDLKIEFLEEPKKGEILVVRKLDQGEGAPVIDGKLEEIIWTNTTTNKGFVTEKGEASSFGGNIRAVHDGKFMYLSVRADEPKENLKSELPDQAELWKETSLEVFFATVALIQPQSLQIAVNPSGSLRLKDLDLRGKVEHKTQISDQYWTMEMKIPLDRLPKRIDKQIYFQIKRNIYGPKMQYSYFNPMPNYGYLTKQFGFLEFQ